MNSNAGLFPALLKHWRNLRGFSQLELALAADVSARHVSFLETGRAKPSEEMILTLCSNLSIPLRDQNTILRAAGFRPRFEEETLSSDKLRPVDQALRYMLEKHDPYPMVVLDTRYNLIASNQSAEKILTIFVANPESIAQPVNLLEMIFHPELSRPFVEDWEKTAHIMLARLHRESLEKRHDPELSNLIDRLLSLPNIPSAWRQPLFSEEYYPTSTLTLKKKTFAYLL